MFPRSWFVRAVVLVLLVLGAGALSADMTGSWSGTYTLTDQACPGTLNGQVSIFATQNGNAFTAVVDMELKFFDDCVASSQKVLFAASGSVSGNAFSGMIFAPLSDRESIPLTGTIAGDSWSAVATPPGQTITLSLTRSDMAPPGAEPLSGTWTGTYTVNATMQGDPCTNLPLFTWSGPVKATFFQAYERIAGIVEMREVQDTDHGPGGKCSIVDMPDLRLAFMALLGPSTISGAIFTAKDTLSMTGAVTTTTMTGSAVAEDGTTFSFSLNKSSPSPDPFVLDFAANPSVIVAGETTTLQWTVFNAVTASIDHGIGSKPAAGTAMIAPSSTTTYAITGAAPHGSTVTALTTVQVAPDTAPFIAAFTATPGLIAAGGCSTLAWTTLSATTVSIDQGIGALAATGSTVVCPSSTTTYTLTATGAGGSAARSAAVVVTHEHMRRRAVRH